MPLALDDEEQGHGARDTGFDGEFLKRRICLASGRANPKMCEVLSVGCNVQFGTLKAKFNVRFLGAEFFSRFGSAGASPSHFAPDPRPALGRRSGSASSTTD